MQVGFYDVKGTCWAIYLTRKPSYRWL